MEEPAPEAADKPALPAETPSAAPPPDAHVDRPQRVRIKVRVRERIKTKHKRDRFRRLLRFIKDYWRVPGLIAGILIAGLGAWLALQLMTPRMNAPPPSSR